jgi:hypothetical protein
LTPGYIYWKIHPPPPPGEISADVTVGGKIMKRGREKGENVKEKEKGERE